MARQKKENLDYFPFDTDFFFDKKIKRLKAKYDTDGICVYLYLLCEMYRDGNGYSVELDEDLILDLSEYFGFSESKISEIIDCLISRSLLEQIPVGQTNILTAKSVQRRYQAAKKGARRDIVVNSKLWLLSEDETESFIKMYPSDDLSGKKGSAGGNYSDKSGKNENKSGINYHNSEKNDTKESKGKESKEKESKVCGELVIPCQNGSYTVSEELMDELTHTYPDMMVKNSLEKLCCYLSANPRRQMPVSSIPGYIRMWLSEDDRAGKYRRKTSGIDTYEGIYDIDEYESYSVVNEFMDFSEYE